MCSSDLTMFQSSPNPFFSQDNYLSQLNCTIASSNSPNNSQETELPVFDFSSWEENLKRDCCVKKCLVSATKEDLIHFKQCYSSLEKNQQELMLLSLLQSYRKPRTGTKREHLEYRLYPFGELCRISFMVLFGVSNNRLVALINHLKVNGVISRKHGN